MYASPLAHVAAISGDTNNVTTGSIDTTGADLLVLVLANANGGTVTISDNKSNTWNALTKRTSEATDCRIYWSRPTTVGSGHTFTASSTGQTPAISVLAFKGSISSPFDVENGAATSGGGGQTTLATGSVTPNQSDELIIAGIANNNAATPTIDSGFTLGDQAGTTSPQVKIAWLIETAAVAKNPTWTPGGNDYIAVTIATFKASPGLSMGSWAGTHGQIL